MALTLPDVNVLIPAFRRDFVNHLAASAWLTSVISGDRYAMSPQVLASVIRITTNRRAFANADRIEDALGFAEALLNQPNCEVILPGPRHWDIYVDLCRRSKARGNVTQDGWFAALAIESGCEWITLDRDYAKFPGLRWRTPF